MRFKVSEKVGEKQKEYCTFSERLSISGRLLVYGLNWVESNQNDQKGGGTWMPR